MTAIQLNTRDLPSERRTDAVRDAVRQATAPAALRLEQPADARVGYWQLGTAATVYSHEGTGLQLTRSESEVRQSAADLVAVALQTAGRGHYRQSGMQQTVEAGGLLLVDLTAPYDYWWSGEGGAFAVQIDRARLGLPAPSILRAARHLDRDPAAYGMLRNHLVQLRQDITGIAALPAPAALVGTATAALLRALVLSAEGEPTGGHHDRLPHIRYWIVQHLSDAELSPERIAAEHDIALRTLYNIWRHPTLTLAQWITRERLEAARRDLAIPDPRPIAAIAQRWGFPDATHFSRRFRAEYGISAREWRAIHR